MLIKKWPIAQCCYSAIVSMVIVGIAIYICIKMPTLTVLLAYPSCHGTSFGLYSGKWHVICSQRERATARGMHDVGRHRMGINSMVVLYVLFESVGVLGLGVHKAAFL